MYDKRVIDILKSQDNYISRSDLRDILLSLNNLISPEVFKLYDKLDLDSTHHFNSYEYLLGFYEGQKDIINMVLFLLYHLKLSDS